MIARLLRWAVLGWQRGVSPWLPPACRFYPSCSAYALTALERFSLPRALALIVWRLLRCQPFCEGGYDPVPGGDEPAEGMDSPAARHVCAASAGHSHRHVR